MAAFQVSDLNSIKNFLTQYSLGEGYQGESCQIHTSYSARTHHTCRFQLTFTDSTDIRRFLLLAVEQTALDRLVFTSSLIEYLASQSILVTPCIKNQQGEYVTQFGDCPALLLELPNGIHPTHQSTTTCEQIGTFLGKMHANSNNFSKKYGNPRSLVWLNLSAEELLPQLSIGDASLLKEQLERFKATVDSQPNLPSGPLIGSLFKDQLFFEQEQLQAVTGFYFSCTDWLLLDVAQAVNEWCCNDMGELDKHLTKVLLAAYHQERPFTPCENQYWQDILCFSATRFWVSRLLTSLIPERAGCPSVQHDPEEYKKKLKRRITGYCPLPT